MKKKANKKQQVADNKHTEVLTKREERIPFGSETLEGKCDGHWLNYNPWLPLEDVKQILFP